MRFHVLGLPHTATNKDYCGCAFTQKVLNLCKMLKMLDYYVIHYGNEGSIVEADEDVVILPKDKVLAPTDALKYHDHDYIMFRNIVIGEIAKRKQPNDFLLCPWPAHKTIADAHSDLIIIESGIGYPSGYFAPFKVFESYAILHAYYGIAAVEKANKLEWYARVIPNAFDPADFEYNPNKADYLLFLGMRHGGIGKGYHIACDVARDAGVRLLVAGPDMPITPIDTPDYVEYVGLLDVKARAQYLSKARALIAPSLFLEPFCGAQVEAFMSGTPVISTDWGAFAEYNIHGKTGFRCNTHGEFVNAVDRVDTLDPWRIREYSQKFTLDSIAIAYDNYFSQVTKCFDGSGGWYA